MTSCNIAYVDGFKDSYSNLPEEPIFDKNLTSDSKVVLLSLFLVPCGEHVTINYISKKIGMSENQVKTALKNLIDNGYVSIERLTGSDGPRGCFWRISGLKGTFDIDPLNGDEV